MQLLLIIAALSGLVYIFFRVSKRMRRTDRIKVTPTLMATEGDLTDRNKTRNFREAMSWKRQKVDYKEMNDTFNQADYQFSKGNYTVAAQGFVHVISLKNDHPEANNKLGIIYIKQEQYKKAEALYRKLTELYPNKALYYSNLGRVFYNQGRLDAAANAYHHAVQLDSRRPERYLSLGQVYRELKRYKESVSVFSKALDLNPRHEDLYFLIVDILDEIKAYEEAVAYLEAMLEFFPYNQNAKTLIIDFRRTMEISPLSSERIRKSAPAAGQNSLFKEFANTKNVEMAPLHYDDDQEEATPAPPSPNQLNMEDIAPR